MGKNSDGMFFKVDAPDFRLEIAAVQLPASAVLLLFIHVSVTQADALKSPFSAN